MSEKLKDNTDLEKIIFGICKNMTDNNMRLQYGSLYGRSVSNTSELNIPSPFTPANNPPLVPNVAMVQHSRQCGMSGAIEKYAKENANVEIISPKHPNVDKYNDTKKVFDVVIWVCVKFDFKFMLWLSDHSNSVIVVRDDMSKNYSLISYLLLENLPIYIGLKNTTNKIEAKLRITSDNKDYNGDIVAECEEIAQNFFHYNQCMQVQIHANKIKFSEGYGGSLLGNMAMNFAGMYIELATLKQIDLFTESE